MSKMNMDEDELGEGREEGDEVWPSGHTSPPGLHSTGKHSPKERNIATRRFVNMLGRIENKQTNNPIAALHGHSIYIMIFFGE